MPALGEEYFKIYRAAIEEGRRTIFPLSMIYDEWTYPAGIVGGQLYPQRPGIITLEEAETDVTGPAAAEVAKPGAAGTSWGRC